MAQFGQGPRNGSPGTVAVPPQWKPVLFVAGVFAGIIILLMLFAWLRQVWTDLMWFDSLAFKSVYTTILTTKVWLFFTGAGVFTLLVSGNVWLVYRYSRGPTLDIIPQPTLKTLRRMVFGGVVFVIAVAALIFGSTAASRWELVLGFANGVPFGAADPQFGKDISFYVFKLPLLHFVQGWLLGVLIVLLLISAALHATLLSLRGARFVVGRSFLIHMSLLGVGILIAFFFNYWLGIFELSFSSRGAVFGASYTDVNARVFTHRLLMAVVVGGAGLLVFNALVLRELRLIGAVVGLWLGAVILVGVLYPALVQRFRVQPSELARERPFIERNIAATRQAFGLGNIKEQTFPLRNDGLNAELVTRNPETFGNLRLWDHRPLRDVLNQIQFIRLYYDFHDVDVDRYTVEGQYRQVMLSARELSPQKLPSEAQRWVNQRLQFTHGYGVAISPVTEFTRDGRPIFFAKDVPPSGVIEVEQPAVYYGETNSNHVIVNSRLPEFDYPTESDTPVYTNYEGEGGVRLSSFWRRLAYAWQFRDVNILISGELSKDSRIMYRRTVQEGIRAVAPFLTLDRDPYIVVADGHLFWIQDAYTVTGRYPYSTPTGKFNYIRNSVKVVMDAYNGTQTYYVADRNDPLVQTFQNIFPTLFQPMEAMPASLRSHIRYPEDLFTIQAQKYLQYHMLDPTVFFNKEDQWSVPNELYFDGLQPMEPYYINMKLPGEAREEFVLLLPFTPSNRPNLVAWLAARNDGEHYGEIVAYTFPKDRQVFGPEQVEARIDNDPIIRQEIALWRQGGARVLRGNLLVIPMENTLIYVEPLYLQPANLLFPELTRVIIVDANRVYMRSSVEAALAAFLGAAPVTPAAAQPAASPTAQTAPPGSSTGPSTVQQRVNDAIQAVEGMRQQLQRLQEALQALQDELRPAGGAR